MRSRVFRLTWMVTPTPDEAAASFHHCRPDSSSACLRVACVHGGRQRRRQCAPQASRRPKLDLVRRWVENTSSSGRTTPQESSGGRETRTKWRGGVPPSNWATWVIVSTAQNATGPSAPFIHGVGTAAWPHTPEVFLGAGEAAEAAQGIGAVCEGEGGASGVGGGGRDGGQQQPRQKAHGAGRCCHERGAVPTGKQPFWTRASAGSQK